MFTGFCGRFRRMHLKHAAMRTNLSIPVALLVLSCFGNPFVFIDGATTPAFATPGRHVCVKKRMEVHHVQTVKSFCQSFFQPYLQRCEGWTMRMCTNYRTIYKTMYRISVQSKMVPIESHVCCPGWTREPGKSGCTKAICEKSCQHSGTCIGPDTCQCVRGWTGEDCNQDTNECSISNGDCHHYYKNTAGSYVCSCRPGYILASDGRSCEVCIRCTAEWKEMEAKIKRLENELQTVRSQSIIDMHSLRDIGSKGEKGDRGPPGPPVKALNSVIGRLVYLDAKVNRCACSSSDNIFPPVESSGEINE